jgi:hypothetical protein
MCVLRFFASLRMTDGKAQSGDYGKVRSDYYGKVQNDQMIEVLHYAHHIVFYDRN